MLKDMTKVQLYAVAVVVAYFASCLTYRVCFFISNSYSAAGFLAFTACIGTFILVGSKAKENESDVKAPPSILLPVSPIRVLGEVKEALASKHFGESRWTQDVLNDQKLFGQWSCKLSKKDQSGERKEHIAVMRVTSQRLGNASSLELEYMVIGESMTNHDAYKLCKDTTEYLQAQLKF